MNTKLQSSIVTQVTGCSELIDFEASDDGNAEAFALLYGDEFLHVKELGWLHWNGKYWEHDYEAAVRAMADTLLQRRLEAVKCDRNDIIAATRRNRSRVMDALTMAESRLKANLNDFDSDKDLLNAANFVIDLRTGEPIEHDPSQRFTYCLSVDYDPTAASSLWETFVQEAVTPEGQEPDKGLLDFIQQSVGYSVTGHTKEEKLYYIYGPTRSGKGTFTEALMTLIPDPIAKEVDFNTFTRERKGDDQNFDLADMKPSRLVFASESNKYQSLNPGKIKQLTGGNMVRTAPKHKGFFEYRPQYTVWLSSNHKVLGDPDDDALWYRVLVVEFPNSRAEREDRDFKDRLKTPEQQRSILSWVVDGAIKWYASDKLHIPERVKMSTEKQREELNTIVQWLKERTSKVEGAFTANGALYPSYVEWCKENGVEPKGNREFGSALDKRGYDADKDYVNVYRDSNGRVHYDVDEGSQTQVRGRRNIRLLPM